jgi:hypothetical protein
MPIESNEELVVNPYEVSNSTEVNANVSTPCGRTNQLAQFLFSSFLVQIAVLLGSLGTKYHGTSSFCIAFGFFGAILYLVLKKFIAMKAHRILIWLIWMFFALFAFAVSWLASHIAYV